MYKIGPNLGLQLMRDFGQPDFPHSRDMTYYLVDGGVIACRPCWLGGNELHVSFNQPGKCRNASIKFCNYFGGEWWALIEDRYKAAINTAKKAGFEYQCHFEGERMSGKITGVHALRWNSEFC